MALSRSGWHSSVHSLVSTCTVSSHRSSICSSLSVGTAAASPSAASHDTRGAGSQRLAQAGGWPISQAVRSRSTLCATGKSPQRREERPQLQPPWRRQSCRRAPTLTALRAELVALRHQPHGLGLDQVQVAHRHLGGLLLQQGGWRRAARRQARGAGAGVCLVRRWQLQGRASRPSGTTRAAGAGNDKTA